MGKDYNLSQIAKEYATKNECGLPLTPEQLLNSVVVYVNGEIDNIDANEFPFTGAGVESVFSAKVVSYENKTVTLEYTSSVNGKKFTMEQPFGARSNGGLSADVGEDGSAIEIGVDMTGAEDNFVLTSINGIPQWKQPSKSYLHILSLDIKNNANETGKLYFTLISPVKETFTNLSDIVLQLYQLNCRYTNNIRYVANGYIGADSITGVRANQNVDGISIERLGATPQSENIIIVDLRDSVIPL